MTPDHPGHDHIDALTEQVTLLDAYDFVEREEADKRGRRGFLYGLFVGFVLAFCVRMVEYVMAV